MDQRVMQITPEVVTAINEELAYVATLSELGRSDTVHYGTAGQVLTLAEYSQQAVTDWVTNPGNDNALHTLRKCAAIAIRALLTEGCPRRVFEDFHPTGDFTKEVFPSSGAMGDGLDSVASSLPAK